jgi:hypothetical protein
MESHEVYVFVPGDGTDDQPFVTDREKMSGYETNLYLYSVSIHTRAMWRKSAFRKTLTSIQNYLGFGLGPSSVILRSREQSVSETGSVSVLR